MGKPLELPSAFAAAKDDELDAAALLSLKTDRGGLPRHDAPYVDPDTWAALTPRRQGSWWPEWQRWLAEVSSDTAAQPATKGTLEPAAGQYIL